MISVIITCYNYARYLSEAVESVIQQTYKNFEIIIVNDGSADETQNIAESLIAKYPEKKIHLINQENQGVSDARNAGITQADGEFILCLDADDIISETMLEETYKSLEKNPQVAIAYTDRQDFGAFNQIVEASEYDFHKLKYFNQLSYCALFKKEVWEKVGGYRTNLKNAPDWDFWIAAGALGFYGIRIPKPLFKYRRHKHGLFTRTQQHFVKVRAQIILNNQVIYSPRDILLAKKTLQKYEQIPNYLPPLVSVIIPTLNRPKKLANAIESVLNQIYQNFEIIVVNDGGVDVEYIVKEKNTGNKILYINESSTHGPAYTRNIGINWASGKYICYLDDDDVYYPDHLETLVNFLDNNNYDVAYSDAYRCVYSRSDDRQVLRKKEIVYSQKFDQNKILISNFIPLICLMHRRSCLDEVGMFDDELPVQEDWDLIIRLSQRYIIHHINKATCEYSWTIEEKSVQRQIFTNFSKTLEAIYNKYNFLVVNKPNILAEQKRNLKYLMDVQTQTLSKNKLLINFGQGFYIDEAGWYWMGEEATLEAQVFDDKHVCLFFEVVCSKSQYYSKVPFQLHIFQDEVLVGKLKFENDYHSIKFGLLLKAGSEKINMRFVSEESFIPRAVGEADDDKRMAVRIGNFVSLDSELIRQLKGESYLADLVNEADLHSKLSELQTLYGAIVEHLKPVTSYQIYQELKKDYDRLQTAVNDIAEDRDKWMKDYYDLERDRDNWQKNYQLLEEDRNGWAIKYSNLEGEINHLRNESENKIFKRLLKIIRAGFGLNKKLNI